MLARSVASSGTCQSVYDVPSLRTDPNLRIRTSSLAGFFSLSSRCGPFRIFIGGGIPAYIRRSPSGSSAKTWHYLTARFRTTFVYFWFGCSSHGNSA